MEKTNELNKFLSYIHMGNNIYRIYHDQAEKFNNEYLMNLVVEAEEIFKRHEEKITKLINEFDEDATESLTFAGLMGVYREKMRSFDSAFDVAINAIKSTNMGLVSAIKFLHENNNLENDIKDIIKTVIMDYENIQIKFITFIIDNLCNHN